MNNIETGWLVWTLLLLLICVICLFTMAWALIWARSLRAEVERWRTAFEDSELDVESLVNWKKRAVKSMFLYCPDEAEAAGLIHRAPLIIGGVEAGTAAVYADRPESS